MLIEKAFMKSNNINIYYEYYKNENQNLPLIVLLHGFLSSSFCFRKLIPLLVHDYNILAIDLPPFGKSDKLRTFTYSYSNMAKTVHECVQKIENNEEIVILGHSMGGQIALNCAKFYPSKFTKLILCNSSGYLPRAKKQLIYATYLPFINLWIKNKLQKQGVVKNLYSCMHDHHLIDEELIKGYEDPFSNPQIFHALKLLLRHREGDLPSRALKEISAPILLLWGSEDKIVPLTVGKRLKEDLPTVEELVVIPNAGHLLPEEKPEEVYRHIKDFLKSNFPVK